MGSPGGRAAPLRMRPRLLVAADPTLPRQAPPGSEAVVVGAGVAGVSAATILAERGVAVTLVEAAATLGGRLGAWPHTLPDGTEQVVEHGFHAFFRHYYTWRDVLRRIDPGLGFLRPVKGYPVISRRFPPEDLGRLPAAPPLNLLALFARSSSLTVADLLGADVALGTELLTFDRARTPEVLDTMSAGDFLAGLRVSDRAREMLFEAFARSFFCDPDGLSAAELVAMFHFYFLGNPAGIGFDAPRTDHLHAIWAPLAEYLRARGATIRTGCALRSLRPDGPGWALTLDDGATRTTRHVVLALDPGGLRAVVGASPELTGVAPRLAAQTAGLTTAPPFVVSRVWLAADVDPGRAVFNAVSGEPTLDSVTVYSRLEEPSAQWARETGGCVLELHSYACTEPDAAVERMLGELAALWPETAGTAQVHRVDRVDATAPAFPPGSAGTRPGVRTDARGVRVAGDFVEAPLVCGLMERAAVTGVLAAADVLAELGTQGVDVYGVPQRGLLAGLPARARHRAVGPRAAT
ncbi:MULTISPECIES: FAD-dependent oxidoreductase [Pseudonocardia]|uniref:FAD-dependent oxidoreductase n=1 Tax=Pseudonocardia TaxID=1847 RepID=UPI00131A4CF0|nr:FAD-dependent oxidoreductase [Pseudonocardia dioxanivorans]